MRFDELTQFSNFNDDDDATFFLAPPSNHKKKLSRGFLRTLWLWRSDQFLRVPCLCSLLPIQQSGDFSFRSSPILRSDEGLESKRGTDVTYYAGKYNLALKSKESSRNPHTIRTCGLTRTVTRQEFGRVNNHTSNRIIMEVSEVRKAKRYTAINM